MIEKSRSTSLALATIAILGHSLLVFFQFFSEQLHLAQARFNGRHLIKIATVMP
jgi:hypothetical protein